MKRLILNLMVLSFAFHSCDSSFLDVKQDHSLEVPTKLEHFDLLLGNTTVFNHLSGHLLGSIAGEEYQLSENSFALIDRLYEKNIYLWQDEHFYDVECADWNYPYQRILYCNIILDGLETLTINEENRNHYNRIKGEALFHRSNAFFMLAQQFAAPYGDKEHEEYGIPLPLNSGINEKFSRSSVSDTYNRIISDLLEANKLLENNVKNIFRPNKSAVLALLARIELVMANYEKSLDYAEQALNFQNSLKQYATIDTMAYFSFDMHGKNNEEIIFYDSSITGQVFYKDKMRINKSLINSYASNDLRKVAFFQREINDEYSYKGSYSGNLYFFTGLATDELYLIAAESAIRLNKINLGLNYINTLLSSRFKYQTYEPYSNLNQPLALDAVLRERRKELLNRGLRWTDLRRFNFLDSSNLSYKRFMENKEYILSGKDKRFTFLIPENVMERSHIMQFPR